MADKTPEQEPSIEEILASIRQIISDDDEKDTSAEPEVVVEDPIEAIFAEEPAPEPEEDVLELTEVVEEPEIEMMEVEAPAPTPRPVPSASPEEPILSDSARHAAIASMAKLAGNMPISRNRHGGSITLEDIVREMLHPMLKDWLDSNLPPMVERMVQKELEKLARRAMDE